MLLRLSYLTLASGSELGIPPALEASQPDIVLEPVEAPNPAGNSPHSVTNVSRPLPVMRASSGPRPAEQDGASSVVVPPTSSSTTPQAAGNADPVTSGPSRPSTGVTAQKITQRKQRLDEIEGRLNDLERDLWRNRENPDAMEGRFHDKIYTYRSALRLVKTENEQRMPVGSALRTLEGDISRLQGEISGRREVNKEPEASWKKKRKKKKGDQSVPQKTSLWGKVKNLVTSPVRKIKAKWYAWGQRRKAKKEAKRAKKLLEGSIGVRGGPAM